MLHFLTAFNSVLCSDVFIWTRTRFCSIQQMHVTIMPDKVFATLKMDIFSEPKRTLILPRPFVNWCSKFNPILSWYMLRWYWIGKTIPDIICLPTSIFSPAASSGAFSTGADDTKAHTRTRLTPRTERLLIMAADDWDSGLLRFWKYNNRSRKV